MTLSIPLRFKEFLVEMETTSFEKNQIREIIQRLINGNEDWLYNNQIGVGDKGNYWLLNYTPGGRNDYNRLVRGMVVEKPQPGFRGDVLALIKGFPFTRFYNHGEKEAAPVDMLNAEMLEKMDGTMVAVWFPTSDHTKPEFNTRKMISTHDADMRKKITSFHGLEATFLPLIQTYVAKLRFSPEDTQFTFVFEFLHEISAVLTRYKSSQYGLYLLGARNLPSHKELTEDELDHVAKRIGSFRPRRFDAVADHAEIHKMFDVVGKDTADFEGFVFRDKKTGNRLKIKDPRYVEKHHMLDGRGYKHLLVQLLQGESEEILAYFPHLKERAKEINEAYNAYIDKTTEKVKEWRAKGLTGRDLSVALFGESPYTKWEIRLKKMRGEDVTPQQAAEKDGFVQSMILKYSRIKDDADLHQKISDELRLIALGQGTNLGDPKAVINMIGLGRKDEADAEVDTGEL